MLFRQAAPSRSRFTRPSEKPIRNDLPPPPNNNVLDE